MGERAARAAEEITPAEAAGPRGGNAHEIIEMAKKTQAEDQEGMNRMLRMVENSETVRRRSFSSMLRLKFPPVHHAVCVRAGW